MNPRICVWLCAAAMVISGCDGKEGKRMAKGKTPVTVHTGTAGAERFLQLPGPIRSARWCEVPLTANSRLAIGPTDTRLLAVIELEPGAWPAWGKAMDSLSDIDVYFLPEEYATGLLPPAWLDAASPDPAGRGRKLTGEMFDPSPIAASWYGGVVAIRHGDHLFIELGSK